MMEELVVYALKACVGSVNRKATDSLCKMPVYLFECRRAGPFQQLGWILDSAFFFFVMLLL